MIGAEEIATAEKLLKIVVGDGMDVPGQFAHYQIDRVAYENFHQQMMSLMIARCQQSGTVIPRTLIPVLNTLLMHHFLVGVVCGRQNPAGA